MPGSSGRLAGAAAGRRQALPPPAMPNGPDGHIRDSEGRSAKFNGRNFNQLMLLHEKHSYM